MLKDACGDRADWRAQVEALEAVAQQLDRDVDHLVWELRPTALDDLGLRAALANYVQDWSKRVSISAELHTSGLLDDRLASETETTLYRIAQEALTNVAKHARAGNVEVILERRADHVLLIVEDDGVGFDPGGDRTRRTGVRPARHAGARRRWSARRSRSNRRPARARPSSCAWRAGRAGRHARRSCLNADGSASHSSGRRSRHRASRAQAARSTASPT